MLTKRISIILISLLIIIWRSTAFSIIDSANIYGIWTKDGSPYLIYNDVEIPQDTSLSIEPGVQIIFQGHYKIEVFGGLFATGNENDSIFFCINDTTGFSLVDSSVGSWNGIDIHQPDNSLQEIKFSYCKFEYSKGLGFDEGGTIDFINNCKKVIIDHCTFIHNYGYYGGCIYYDGAFIQGDVQITNCSFKNNKAYLGGAIYLWWYNHAHLISHNTFFTNQANSGGALFMSGGEINHNLFYRNLAFEYGGAVWNGSSTSLVIENSIFNENDAPYGGAYYVNNGAFHSKIINCTMINNLSENSVLFIGSNAVGDFQIINTIIWNPGSESIVRESSETEINVIFSLIQNASDSIWFSDSCIDLNPKIVAPEQHNYHLNWDSPAIDAGLYDTSGYQLNETDFYDEPRINNGRIDIGAVEYDTSFVAINPKDLIEHEIRIYPNPSFNYIRIESTNKNLIIKELILYDFGGKVIMSETVDDFYKVLKVDHLLSGAYLLKANFKNGYTYSRQIIKK